MVVPTAEADVDVADASLDEAAGEEAAGGKVARSIFVADGGGLFADIEGVERGELHAIGRFHRLDAAFEVIVGTEGAAEFAIECLLSVELTPQSVFIRPFVLQIRNHVDRIRFGMIERSALMLGGEETGAGGRAPSAQGNKGGQVIAFASQSIGKP